MAAKLGKRKREVAQNNIEASKDSSEDEKLSDAQELFRRHFESKFKPLPIAKKPTKVVEEVLEDEDSDENADEDSDWDGISQEKGNSVEVVVHADTQANTAKMSKEEIKAFMTSKPPTSTISTFNVPPSTKTQDDDDSSEQANLKKDLELQRFLQESHLLDSSTNSTLSGTNRHKATDLRLQALGSKTSIFKQEKMPMTHRKGIIAKQSEREAKRRAEAKENGIILEKAKAVVSKGSGGKRERGVGAPGVGKFAGGMLKLSKKDVFEIEGPKRMSSGRGGRGGGRGRGKRGRG